jgi:hypothetical protein
MGEAVAGKGFYGAGRFNRITHEFMMNLGLCAIGSRDKRPAL